MKNDVDVRERVLNRLAIAQIALYKFGVAVDPSRLATLMRVRFEIIENPHAPAFAHEQIDHMRTDQACPAGDERALHFLVDSAVGATVAATGQIRSRPSLAMVSAKNFLVAGASRRNFPSTNSIAQTPQRRAIINVINISEERELPVRLHAHVRPSGKNSLRAPIDLFEKVAMQFFHPNQIISTIIGWPQHDSIVCILQLRYGLAKCLHCRGWTV